MQIQGIFWVTSTAIIGINMRSTGTKKIAKMSKNAGDFSIPGRNFFHEDMGTLQAPKIVKITFGERFEKSLIFHCKVGSNFYCYWLVEVNSRTAAWKCLNWIWIFNYEFKILELVGIWLSAEPERSCTASGQFRAGCLCFLLFHNVDIKSSNRRSECSSTVV